MNKLEGNTCARRLEMQGHTEMMQTPAKSHQSWRSISEPRVQDQPQCLEFWHALLAPKHLLFLTLRVGVLGEEQFHKHRKHLAAHQPHGHAVAWGTLSCMCPCETSKPLPGPWNELFSSAKHHKELKGILTPTKQIPNEVLKDQPPPPPPPPQGSL